MAPGDTIGDPIPQILTSAMPIVRSPYLEPEDSPFSRAYDSPMQQLISKRLVEPGQTEVDSIAARSLHPQTASVVCLPTYEPQWALWVVGESRYGYSVVSTEFDLTKPEAEITTPEPFDLSDEKGTLDWLDSISARALTIYVKPLPVEQAVAVCEVWSKVLVLTRYCEAELAACDGITYHFGYVCRGSTRMAGRTWSPEGSSVPGKLASLSRALREHVRNPDRIDDLILQRIDEGVSSLRLQLREIVSADFASIAHRSQALDL